MTKRNGNLHVLWSLLGARQIQSSSLPEVSPLSCCNGPSGTGQTPWEAKTTGILSLMWLYYSSVRSGYKQFGGSLELVLVSMQACTVFPQCVIEAKRRSH